MSNTRRLRERKRVPSLKSERERLGRENAGAHTRTRSYMLRSGLFLLRETDFDALFLDLKPFQLFEADLLRIRVEHELFR
jgi:hypothetical protein